VLLAGACRPAAPIGGHVTTVEDPQANERKRRAEAERRAEQQRQAELECQSQIKAARAETDLARKTRILDAMTPECVKRMSGKTTAPPPLAPGHHNPPPAGPDGPRVVRRYKTRRVCFVGHPWPACRGLWGFDFTLRHGTAPYFSAEMAAMRNLDRRTAIGLTFGFGGSFDDDDGNGGFMMKLRVRRWIGVGHRIFGAPYYEVAGGGYYGQEDEPDGRGFYQTTHYLGAVGEVTLGIGDLIGLSAGINASGADGRAQADLTFGVRVGIGWAIETFVYWFGWVDLIPDLRKLPPIR
jgi:hypothetical protein